jgi:hypothetical protein
MHGIPSRSALLDLVEQSFIIDLYSESDEATADAACRTARWGRNALKMAAAPGFPDLGWEFPDSTDLIPC